MPISKINKMFQNKELERFKDIKPEFKTAVNGNEATLYIYGDIGESWWDDSVSANEVKDFLNGTNANVIHVHINSLGGDAFDGVAIHNQLKSHKAKIIVHVDGIAASAASVIAMAGDEINMPATSMLMIHNAWTFAYGNARELRKVAEDLDKISHSVSEAYMTRFVGTREELNQLLDQEEFLTAEEAIAFGLADEVIEEAEETSREPGVAVKTSLLAKYAAKAKQTDDADLPEENPPAEQPQTKQNILSRFKRPAEA
ncbi:head maturation protease, ClpP-related [Jeotgalibacillus haloalkalitolerans]|uniref:ATP-dependent Clp protease proteolytic subunit n=1 Tax=Jeotgalibacillus haloalkalitolerans TaxID=3104292 RepID=A0ABU5KND6_9BACL|nr:head maturation protease, ClpP-related [Jeotgalibacillus sp. HH7-29]MDZ5712246.1 Clp protease ClpP [Jeotgalibacillus sp. HH7-29]